MTDTEIEQAMDFDDVQKLINFKEAYGKYWRDIAIKLIEMQRLRVEIEKLTSKESWKHQINGK